MFIDVAHPKVYFLFSPPPAFYYLKDAREIGDEG
jgi:hypothetical protein